MAENSLKSGEVQQRPRQEGKEGVAVGGGAIWKLGQRYIICIVKERNDVLEKKNQSWCGY